MTFRYHSLEMVEYMKLVIFFFHEVYCFFDKNDNRGSELPEEVSQLERSLMFL